MLLPRLGAGAGWRPNLGRSTDVVVGAENQTDLPEIHSPWIARTWLSWSERGLVCLAALVPGPNARTVQR